MTNTDPVLSCELIDECEWYYDPEADTEGGDGNLDDLGDSGYYMGCYFAFGALAHEYQTRAAGLAAMRASYLGCDPFGIGLRIPTD
jgi:hypothetical protein